MIIQELKLRDFPYLSRRSLAERIARRFLLKKGYDVFRGTQVFGPLYSEFYWMYEPVRKRYDKLEAILLNKLGLNLYLFRQDLESLSGLPDFFIHRNKECTFVEVKLGHEQLRKNQVKKMQLLEYYGFEVILIRVKDKIYRERAVAELSSDGWNEISNRKVIAKQEKLKVKYRHYITNCDDMLNI